MDELSGHLIQAQLAGADLVLLPGGQSDGSEPGEGAIDRELESQGFASC